MWIQLLETILNPLARYRDAVNLIKSEFSAKIKQQKRKDELSKLKNPKSIKQFYTAGFNSNKES